MHTQYKENRRVSERHGLALPKQGVEKALERGLMRARTVSRTKGWGFDLDLDWCLRKVEEQGFRCALTGIPFFSDPAPTPRNPYIPSFDRIDCARGYTKDNVRTVVFAINFMRSDWDLDVVEHVMREFLKQRSSKP